MVHNGLKFDKKNASSEIISTHCAPLLSLLKGTGMVNAHVKILEGAIKDSSYLCTRVSLKRISSFHSQKTIF